MSWIEMVQKLMQGSKTCPFAVSDIEPIHRVAWITYLKVAQEALHRRDYVLDTKIRTKTGLGRK